MIGLVLLSVFCLSFAETDIKFEFKGETNTVTILPDHSRARQTYQPPAVISFECTSMLRGLGVQKRPLGKKKKEKKRKKRETVFVLSLASKPTLPAIELCKQMKRGMGHMMSSPEVPQTRRFACIADVFSPLCLR